MSFKPSKFQQAILAAVAGTRDNLVIEAVAGSGKSTTLELICGALVNPRNAKLLAFNTAITKELTEKFKRKGIATSVQGINSAGHGMLCKFLGRVELDDNKYLKLVDQCIKGAEVEDEDGEIKTAFIKTVRFVQSQLIDPRDREAVIDMCEHFDVDLGAAAVQNFILLNLPSVIKAGIDMAKEQKVISFSDQLYLPVVFNLRPWQVETVMVDEAQDLSPAQLEIVRKHCMKGGRMIFVGDSRQAIYGFAGADADSIKRIIKVTNAKVLPLSICYRCPSSHIALAQGIVPQIEASETAIVGTVETIKRELFASRVAEGDLVMCRTTAPLVEACFELIGLGMPARIKGRDIGRGLVKLMQKIQKEANGSAMRIDQVIPAIYSFETKALNALAGQKDAEQKASKLNDQIASLVAIFNMGKPSEVGQPSTKVGYTETPGTGFYREIEDLFSDGRPGITLATIHRVKGLENDRTFILKPDLLPHPMAKKDWQIEQEYNLKYVALTRAKVSMTFVED